LKIKDFGRTKSGVDYHETMGFNFKFTDLQAVIGIEQMKKLEWRVGRKKEMYRLYREMLEDMEDAVDEGGGNAKGAGGIKLIKFIDTNLEDTSPWFIDILVDKKKRDGLASFLRENGIGTRPFYPAIHTQPPYSHVKGTFENSEHVASSGLWLPSSSFLSDDDIAFVCQKIKDFFKAKVGGKGASG
jgi:perosamine synthetase